MTPMGSPNPCSVQCAPGAGQTWEELGKCLSERVEVVVCKPAAAEIGDDADQNASQSSGSAAQTSAMMSSSASAAASASSGAPAQASTAAASSNMVVHATTSKVGVALFALLAFGSAAGMLL